MKVENMKNFEQEQEEVNATDALLHTIEELANKCFTLEEFREALARIIASK